MHSGANSPGGRRDGCHPCHLGGLSSAFLLGNCLYARQISLRGVHGTLFNQGCSLSTRNLEIKMDKDRVAGSAKQASGAIKQAAGKLTGDGKLKAEGAAEKSAGKVQNAVGGAKDAVREAVKKK
jgi:uncharacterized protein YjbJ (UPF0337 family)